MLARLLALSVAVFSITAGAECLKENGQSVCKGQTVLVLSGNVTKIGKVKEVVSYYKKVVIDFGQDEVSDWDLNEIYRPTGCVSSGKEKICVGNNIYQQSQDDFIPGKVLAIHFDNNSVLLKNLSQDLIYPEIRKDVNPDEFALAKDCLNGICVGDDFTTDQGMENWNGRYTEKIGGKVYAINFVSGEIYFACKDWNPCSINKDRNPRNVEIINYSSLYPKSSPARDPMPAEMQVPPVEAKDLNIKLMHAIWSAGGYRQETTPQQAKREQVISGENIALIQEPICTQTTRDTICTFHAASDEQPEKSKKVTVSGARAQKLMELLIAKGAEVEKTHGVQKISLEEVRCTQEFDEKSFDMPDCGILSPASGN